MPHAELSELLAQSRRPAVLTGAGMSAESGITTFRDALTGLWQRFNAEELASPEAFRRDPELVWGWYEWRRMGVLRAQPNPGHLALERLGKRFPNLPIITQNVDDLHERAGSTQVLHLHGSLHRPRCASCGTGYSLTVGIPSEPEGGRRLAPPRCDRCGGLVRPGVVWFGEALPEPAWRQAEQAVRDCDLLLVVGTSGIVWPAAGLPMRAKQGGARLVQVNPHASALDPVADLNFRHPASALEWLLGSSGLA